VNNRSVCQRMLVKGEHCQGHSRSCTQTVVVQHMFYLYAWTADILFNGTYIRKALVLVYNYT